jgi:D-tyrosyl-tRNA(Tyr) deacylase
VRAVVQRVSRAEVRVGGECCGRIGPGLLALVGAGKADGPAQADALADKIVQLRIFEDDAGKMNRSLLETGGGLLVVSQFTLYGDTRKGRRPSFFEALEPEAAERLISRLTERARAAGVPVETGKFGAMMEVELVNAGPVTLLLETA